MVKPNKVTFLSNDVFHKDNKHYITLFVHCEMLEPKAEPQVHPQIHPNRAQTDCADAVYQVMEPDKCESWTWKTLDEIKEIMGSSEPGDVLFLPLHHMLGRISALRELRAEAGKPLST